MEFCCSFDSKVSVYCINVEVSKRKSTASRHSMSAEEKAKDTAVDKNTQGLPFS